MNVCSIEFLLFLPIVAVAFSWLPSIRLRQLLLTLCNFGFVCTLMPSARDGMVFGMFVVSGYVVSRILQVRPRRWILAAYITLLIAAFLILKRYAFITPVLPAFCFAHTISVVGLSYMLFRQIHVAVDCQQGQIANLSFWTYFNYDTNLFGLLAGPIQRYQEFAEDWNRLAPMSSDTYGVLRSYCRVFFGVLKIAFVAALCLSFYNRYIEQFDDFVVYPQQSQQSRVKVIAKFLALFYLYPLYIYFNFSGYCDIVIGAAKLFGIRMPENFDSPFLSRNMIEYWTRWHKTLGAWIRDYVFTPLYMTIARHWPSRAASLVFLCYFVSLFITGVWHGSTWNFVVFGVLNGVGVSVAKLWENLLVKSLGRQGFKAYLKSMSIHVASVILTFHFVCLTIFFFPMGVNKCIRILKVFAIQLLPL